MRIRGFNYEVLEASLNSIAAYRQEDPGPLNRSDRGGFLSKGVIHGSRLVRSRMKS